MTTPLTHTRQTSTQGSAVRLPENTVADQIGDTPLIQLTHLTRDLPDTVRIFGKAEHLNPGGSVKDRPALAMITAGLASGDLSGETTLIDATSGNTGIAYAMLGAALDIPVTLALPENATEERKKTLRTYGAELILTDPMEGTDGAQNVVKELVGQYPDRYYYPDQYNNEANWQAHYEGTGAEILSEIGNELTHFVAGLGTTGTFMGIARRLKEANPDIQCIAVQPATPLHGLEGMKHMESALVPGIYDPDAADELLFVETEDAYEITRRLAREEGLFLGPSSGAAVAASLTVARELSNGTVATIFCDGGSRYLSEDFWTK